MGRRSINTTKSGKYMNPTDQHRKEARKRELRKNKKQRLIVRTAVLKGKDPYQIIADMERLDQMEYNVSTPPPLNEKVLKDKRRKMKETWDRLLRLYNKEDHQRFLELKRMEVEYESKRNQMIKFFESVKSAQEVTIDDIPLPSAAPTDPNMPTAGSSMPSFLSDHSIPQSILKRQTVSSKTIGPHRAPPGVPPGPPPVLSDLEDDLDDEEDSEGDEKDKSKRIRFSEDLQTGEKDADVNEFLKELEQMEKTVPNSDHNVSQTIQSIQSLPAAIASQPTPTAAASAPPSLNAVPPPPSLQTNLRPSGPPPPMMMFRPPVPPSGLRPGSQPQNIPGLMVGRPPISGPPPMSGPPPPMGPMRPGVPPHHRMINSRPMMQPMRPMGPGFPSTAGPPMGGKRDDKKTHVVSDRATIEAKPQLRNLSADATRFTPVALRVKRDDKGVKRSVHKSGFDDMKRYSSVGDSAGGLNAPTKGDAYDQFMKEMENLL